MKNFANYPRLTRELIAKNYNLLDRSEFVDLVLSEKGKIALKAKNELGTILNRKGRILNGTLMQEIRPFNDPAKQEGSVIDIGLWNDNNEVRFKLDFGTEKNAQEAMETVNGAIDNVKDAQAQEYLTQFGALIEIAARMAESIKKIKSIFEEGLRK